MDPSDTIDGVWTDLFAARRKPVQWIIKDLLTTGLAWVVGPPKDAKKSTQALGMGLLVAGYGCSIYPAFMSNPMVDSQVYIVSAEADAGELRDMAEGVLGCKGAIAKEAILVADDPWEFQLDTEKGMHLLASELEKRLPKLVILDPFVELHSQDENDAVAIVKILKPIRDWAKRNDSCVLVVHHPRKLAQDQVKFKRQDARGSGAIAGKADTHLTISPMGAYHTIEAVFKRARGWTRDLVLGLDGEAAREVITPDDRKVHEAYGPDVDIDALARILKMSPSVIRESVAKLTRNEMLGGTNK
jgi:hypothetical protein